MTLNEFIKKLEKTPREWKLGFRYFIRAKGQCPIEVIAHVVPGGHHRGAVKLGIRDATRRRIVLAADKATRHDPRLRARLLKACGL